MKMSFNKLKENTSSVETMQYNSPSLGIRNPKQCISKNSATTPKRTDSVKTQDVIVPMRKEENKINNGKKINNNIQETLKTLNGTPKLPTLKKYEEKKINSHTSVSKSVETTTKVNKSVSSPISKTNNREILAKLSKQKSETKQVTNKSDKQIEMKNRVRTKSKNDGSPTVKKYYNKKEKFTSDTSRSPVSVQISMNVHSSPRISISSEIKVKCNKQAKTSKMLPKCQIESEVKEITTSSALKENNDAKAEDEECKQLKADEIGLEMSHLNKKLDFSEKQCSGFTSETNSINIDSRVKSKQQLNSALSVSVRVRPFTLRESSSSVIHSVVSMTNDSITVNAETGNTYNFSFDHCFWSLNPEHQNYANQEFVHEKVAVPLLTHVFEGYNICLFAYGQTGSGKSYSMMGSTDEQGIIPRFCQQLFQHTSYVLEYKVKYLTEISYFEIYNEKIYDLLTPGNDNAKVNLRVREHPVLGPYVQDLTTYVVTSYNDLWDWLVLGNKHRATATTVMNDRSSRSHSIFVITLTQIKTETIDDECHEHTTTSRINFVDLAGSERINKSKTSGERLKEGVNINKSLLTLGKVITQLAECHRSQGNEVNNTFNPKKGVFIPYRDSTLTWLLKESLGGNSRTAMLATISPCNTHIEETLGTLRYATQAGKIINIARVNEDPKAHLVRELKAEIEKLRNQQQESDVKSFIEEIGLLKSQLKESQLLLDENRRIWEEKLKEAEKRKKEEEKQLKRVGIALTMDGECPGLINLNEDPYLSETLLYVLNPGITRLGRMDENSNAEIQLKGKLIADNHCVIRNENDTVIIEANHDAAVYVNGQLITAVTQLNHGDRIVIGGEHFFRYSNPHEEKDLLTNAEKKDFEFACQELMTIQEVKLQEELDISRQATCKELIENFENLKQEIGMELSIHKTSYDELMQEQKDSCDESMEQVSIQKYDAGKEYVPYSSDLLDQITALFNDTCSDLDSLKMKLFNTTCEFENNSHISNEKFGSLYQLSLKIKESNELTKELETDIVLSRCDILTNTGLEQAVKVHSTKNGIATFWSIKVFEERLERLQKLVQESPNNKNAINDIFDAGDIWERDDEVVFTGINSVPKLKQIQKRLTQSSSSAGSTDTYSHMNGSYSHRYSSSSISSPILYSVSHEIAMICRNLLAEKTQISSGDLDEVEPSLYFDRIILQCLEVLDCIDKINQRSENISLSNNEDDWKKLLINLIATFNCLQLSVEGWMSFPCHDNLAKWVEKKYRNSKLIDLKHILSNLTKAMIFIFQGVEKDLDSLIKQWVDSAQQTVCQLIRVLGETSVISKEILNINTFMKAGKRLSDLILDGAVRSVGNISQAGYEEIEEYELQYCSFMEDSFFGPVKESWFSMQATRHSITKLKEFVKAFQFDKENWMKITEVLSQCDKHSNCHRTCAAGFDYITKLTDHVINFICSVDFSNKYPDFENLAKSSTKELIEQLESFHSNNIDAKTLIGSQSFNELENKRIEAINAFKSIAALTQRKVHEAQQKDAIFPVIDIASQDISRSGHSLCDTVCENRTVSSIPESSSIFALSSFFTNELEDVIDI